MRPLEGFAGFRPFIDFADFLPTTCFADFPDSTSKPSATHSSNPPARLAMSEPPRNLRKLVAIDDLPPPLQWTTIGAVTSSSLMRSGNWASGMCIAPGK